MVLLLRAKTNQHIVHSHDMSAYAIQSVTQLGGCHFLGCPPPLGLCGCTLGLQGGLRLPTRSVWLLFLRWWLCGCCFLDLCGCRFLDGGCVVVVS